MTISYILSLYLIRTVRIIPTNCSKLNPYELAGEPNEPIGHELQRFEIN